MLQQDKLLAELQKQLKETDNEQVKLVLGNVIADILSGKFQVDIWD